MTCDIFICCCREDGRELARPLKSELVRRGYRVFLDFDEVKESVSDRRIIEAIDAAPIFMVILSPHALDRCVNVDDWVRREIEYALAHERHFIPVDPDRSFAGFPPDFPDSLKEGLGQHRLSPVIFGPSLTASVDEMVRERIEPLLLRSGRAVAPARSGTLSRIETEMLAAQAQAVFDRGDWYEATVLWRKAAEQGHGGAQYCLGRCCYYGWGVAQDYAEAVRWWREAAELGYSDAQSDLGMCCDNGRGMAQNSVEAVEWYRRAAEQGNRFAQCNLGGCYSQGRGVAQDWAEAVRWWREAAEQGYDVAQNNLGECYYYGWGVAQDYAEAVEWYRRAAGQGNCDAQSSLGFCYYNGCGVAQDYAEAVEWYRRAAEQGDSDAQNDLGECYYYGRGVAQDRAEAVEWYRRAADNGHESAQARLDEMEKMP